METMQKELLELLLHKQGVRAIDVKRTIDLNESDDSDSAYVIRSVFTAGESTAMKRELGKRKSLIK